MASPGLVRLHRWFALTAGAFISVTTLAGASLVFREELTARLTPAVALPARPAQAGDYQRVLDAARRAAPAADPISIVPPSRDDRATEVILGPSDVRTVFVNPGDGTIVADSDREWLPFASLFRLHMRYAVGPAGEYLVGAAGIALAFLAATGLWMWWPARSRRAWKVALRVRFDANRLGLAFDLHRVVGACFALILLVNALIGISMVFPDAASGMVNRIAGAADPPPVKASVAKDAVSLDDIVASADRAFPRGRVTRVTLGAPDAPVVVRKRMDGDNVTHGMNRIYVDRASASVLRVDPLAASPPGNAMFEWLYPLHTGMLLGTPYRLLLVLAGCAPLVSLVTGLIVWRSRAKRRKSSDAIGAARVPGKSLEGVQ